MTFRTLMRFSGVWWLIPALIGAQFLHLATSSPGDPDYGLAVQLWVQAAQPLTLPFTAVATTLAGSRIYRSGVLQRPLGRRAVAVWVLPVLTATVATLMVSLVFQIVLVAQGSDGIQVRPIIPAVAWAAGMAALGMIVGRELPLRVAAPLAAVAPYLMIAMPAALEPLWLRHLEPTATSCCTVREELAPVVVLASSVVGLSFFVAGAVMLRRTARNGGVTRVVASGVVVCSVITAAMLVHDRDYSSSQPRAGSLTCVDVDLVICVWPADAESIGAAEREVEMINEIALRYGLEMPRRLVDLAPEEVDDGESVFRVSGRATPRDVQRSVISSIVPGPSLTCLDQLQSTGDGESAWDLLLAHDAAVAWWEAQVSTEPVVNVDEQGEGPDAEARRELLALPPQEGADAVADIVHRIRTCDPAGAAAP